MQQTQQSRELGPLLRMKARPCPLDFLTHSGTYKCWMSCLFSGVGWSFCNFAMKLPDVRNPMHGALMTPSAVQTSTSKRWKRLLTVCPQPRIVLTVKFLCSFSEYIN